MTQETQLTTEKKPMTVKQYVNSDLFKQQIAQALPTTVSIDRFMRCFYTQLQKNPKLMRCTHASLQSALIQCAEFGLFPNGRDAHLIPYKDTATCIWDYKGIVKLILDSGKVATIYADVVCENDEFEFNKGKIEKHSYKLGQDRGKVIGAFAFAEMSNGAEVATVMSMEELEGIRKRSRSGGSGPWVTDTNEMRKKTAVKRLSKLLPLSGETAQAIQADDDGIDFDRMQKAEVEVPEMPEADAETEEELSNNQKTD